MLPNRKRNKMKNYEKYADEIKKFDDNNFCDGFTKPYILKKDSCDGISSCEKCRMLQMLWLLEEYKEPEIDWSKVEVDTPILVRNSEDGEWLRRYFATYENGAVYAWDSGCTSWSASNMTACMTAWEFAKLAESEEE